MLQIKNLKKYFGGVKAVDNCSFEISPGITTALIGPNGAGKSTVFELISGILKADFGEIIFDNKNIMGLSPEDISNLGISRLFQHSRLFDNLTVKENLLLALDNEDMRFFRNLFGRNKITRQKEQIISDNLKSVGLERFKLTQARDLSYGQKRLIEFLRAILNPHKFLMLDEPVAGVTPKLREEIAEVLIGLKEKHETVLLIEHDMNFTFKVADHIIVLEKGRVIAEGEPKEIRDNPRVLEAYLGD